MGIIINALSIMMGTFFGHFFKERIKLENFSVLGISIMIISIVGFLENIFDVNGITLKSNDLLIVVFALIIGTLLGDMINLENKISRISNCSKKGFSNIIDCTIFFGVGGLQICGPILLATSGDNSQLILKSIIDMPFALMFGISYGKTVAVSAIPVAFGQFVIMLITMFSRDFFDTSVIKQICAMGYIILFFSGFNLMCEKNHKINNVNMIVGIFIVVLYNMLIKLWR